MRTTHGLTLGLLLFTVGNMEAQTKQFVPQVDGKVPSLLTLEHFQREPVPNRMPLGRDWDAPKNMPLAGTLGQALHGLMPTLVLVSTPNLSGNSTRSVQDAFALAEYHFKACNGDEARQWYREVVRLAPRSPQAAIAHDRLGREHQSDEPRLARPSQTIEPPLASATLSELQLRVLWEAAKQYKDAVEQGDQTNIAKAGKVLDDALKVTRAPAKPR